MFRVSLLMMTCFVCWMLRDVNSREVPAEAHQDDIKTSNAEDIRSHNLKDLDDVTADGDRQAPEDMLKMFQEKLKDLESLLSIMTNEVADDRTIHESTRRRKRDSEAGATIPPFTTGSKCGNDESYYAHYPAGYHFVLPFSYGFPQDPHYPMYPMKRWPEGHDLIDGKGQQTFGTTYVRWGRSDCPETAQKVYDGLIGGSWSQDTGNGANYLCLPSNPSFSSAVSGSQLGRSRIRSVELHAPSNFPPFDHIGDGEFHEMTCAVCRVTSRSTVLMVPAMNACPAGGWTLEYSGYMVSDHHNANGRAEYICLDGEPQGFASTSSDSLGGNLYLVESICVPGGLPCGPYVDGYELLCVVCTM